MIQKTQENPDGYRGLVKNKLPPALVNALQSRTKHSRLTPSIFKFTLAPASIFDGLPAFSLMRQWADCFKPKIGLWKDISEYQLCTALWPPNKFYLS